MFVVVLAVSMQIAPDPAPRPAPRPASQNISCHESTSFTSNAPPLLPNQILEQAGLSILDGVGGRWRGRSGAATLAAACRGTPCKGMCMIPLTPSNPPSIQLPNRAGRRGGGGATHVTPTWRAFSKARGFPADRTLKQSILSEPPNLIASWFTQQRQPTSSSWPALDLCPRWLSAEQKRRRSSTTQQRTPPRRLWRRSSRARRRLFLAMWRLTS